MRWEVSMRWFVAVLCPLLAACGDNLFLSIDTPPECNPLGGTVCVDPWPSSIYQREDPSSPTGVRIDLPLGALPATRNGDNIEVETINSHTGFSPATQIVTTFPGGIDPSNLPSWTDYGASVAMDSPTVILDMSTGERVAHFAEVDANHRTEDLSTQAVYLRPAARLKGGTRYAVAFRRSIRRKDGKELESPRGFIALRDRLPTDHERLEAIRDASYDVLDALENAGIPRGDLVVAWDFVTASDEAVRADTLAARDAALAAMGDRGANLAIQIVSDDRPAEGDIAREVVFDYESPMILRDDGFQGFARAADGTPMVVGESKARAVAIVPRCTRADGGKLPVLMFGHGFLGGAEQIQSGFGRNLAHEMCMVLLAGTWRGLSMADLPFAGSALLNPNRGWAFGERIVQGIIDFIALEQLSRGALASEILVEVDPTQVYFLGVSQGHILGSTFYAYDPFITRAILHVGGAEWSLLFERSVNWTSFNIFLGASFGSLLKVVIAEQLLQMMFDYTDPVHVARGALDTPLPGTPPKQWLLHESDGDASVSNLGTELQARTMGLPVLSPALRVPYGMTEKAGPLPSGLVIWTERPEPYAHASNLSDGLDNVAHERLGRRPKVLEQMRTFLETGQIVHVCGAGPCDCAAGACGPLP